MWARFFGSEPAALPPAPTRRPTSPATLVYTCTDLLRLYSEGSILFEKDCVQHDGKDYWQIKEGQGKGGLVSREPASVDGLGRGVDSRKYETYNMTMDRRVRASQSLEAVEGEYANGVPYDAVLFWDGCYIFRVANGPSKDAFIFLDPKDVIGVDERVLVLAKCNYILKGLFGDAWKWRSFRLGDGSVAATSTSDVLRPSLDLRGSILCCARPDRDARKTDDGGSPSLSTASAAAAAVPPPRRVARETGGYAYFDDFHCVPGAVLNALRDYPEYQVRLESAFFDEERKCMLHSEIGPWLARDCGYVKVHAVLRPSFSQLQRLADSHDKYILALALANGARHAISLDFARGLTYDSDGGDDHDASLQDVLRRLLNDDAEITYLGRLLITAESRVPNKRKRKDKKRKQVLM
eukprot:CAMPEP_0118896720 /NCGR_PEP_ID=MMETSP1166-20130328/4450_1 /TAXON_ID=1104430 /ORGANISM="Chrysoreinhardia sp, Strain CCMP3193" /LENGTH=408 /DNA_ID=CAMNT_0006835779 /DNA_START=12 /DNA_END=1238 /DNA_ORIENTATION=+